MNKHVEPSEPYKEDRTLQSIYLKHRQGQTSFYTGIGEKVSLYTGGGANTYNRVGDKMLSIH